MTVQRSGNVEFTVDAGVCRVVLDRPEVRNAIDPDLAEGLAAAIDHATAERARVMLIRGNGVDFCAGADLGYIRSVAQDEPALGGFVARLAAVLDRLEAAPFVTLAAVHGHAVAGGCEMLLACDFALAAADARIGDRHLGYGLLPGAGGSVRLIRALTQARARYLLFSGDPISGEEAAAWGLVTRAVPAPQLGEAAEAIAGRLARHSGDALRRIKQMAVGVRDMPFGDAIVEERRLFLEHFRDSGDPHEGLVAFAEGRPPRF